MASNVGATGRSVMATGYVRPAFVPPIPAYSPTEHSRYGTGMLLLAAFLFLSYSKIGEWGISRLHLPLITSALAMIVCLLQMKAQRSITSNITILLAAFSAWLVVGVPFATWKGNAFDLVVKIWSKSMLLFVLIAALPDNLRHMRLLMGAMGWSSITVVMMTYVIGKYSSDGRLHVPIGSLSNPNDMAQVILIGLPFWFYLAVTQQSTIRKHLMLLGLLPAMHVIFQAGSRGALLAIAALCGLMFINVSVGSKLKLAIFVMLATVAAIPFVSQEALQRLKTTFVSTHGASAEEQSAVLSRESRIFLFKEGLRLTLENPIMGVGGDCFVAAANEDPDPNEPRIVKWHEAHNAYVQVSSETGLPGFFFYFSAMFLSVRYMKRLQKQADRSNHTVVADMAKCVRFAMLSFALTSLFSNYAYLIYFPTLAGLAVSMKRVGEAVLSTATPKVQAPVPVWKVPRLPMIRPIAG